MTVQFFAYLRDSTYANCRETTVSGANDVGELGRILSKRYGPKFRDEFFDETGVALGQRIIVMVNGRRVEFLNNLRTALSDTDVIQIFPVVAGG